jgi:hypothetical protein
MPCHHFINHFDGQMAPTFAPPAQIPNSDCGCGGDQMIPYPNQQMIQYPNQQMIPYPNQQMIPYPNQQMESNTHMMPDAYPMPELSGGGGIHPLQFGNMQEDGEFYPKPPSFPNFGELRTDNNDDKQDE